ncbi:MAG: hypothetical protein AAF322_07830 [Pseudomonadota bacterium]
MSLEKTCIDETHRLHRWLEDWLTGASPSDASAFAPFEAAIAPGFEIVSPRGSRTSGPDVVAEIRAAHGAAPPDLKIRVENAAIAHLIGDHALVTYEEWHESGGARSARLATVLYREEPAAPGGVVWLHVHETWLPGLAPPAGERFPEEG